MKGTCVKLRASRAALDLHTESGLAALAKAGLMEEFKAHYRPGAELCRITDQQLSIRLDEHGSGRKQTLAIKATGLRSTAGRCAISC